MKYFFLYNHGVRKELTKEECFAQIKRATQLDDTMIEICLDKEGVAHTFGRWVKEK